MKHQVENNIVTIALETHLPPCPGSSFRDIARFSLTEEETSVEGLRDMIEDLQNRRTYYSDFIEAYSREIEFMLQGFDE